MKPTPSSFPIKAGAALGFIIMALVGWNLGDSSSKAAAPSAESTTPDNSTRPDRRMRGAGGPSDAASQRMAVIRASGDEGERMRATLQLASSLPTSEFAAWMDGRWFSLREGASLTLFNKILMERWQLEDPDGLLVWSMKNQSGRAARILGDWAETDPQRMLDFFKQHPNNEIELRALTSLAKNHPDLALQRLLEMGKEGFSIEDGYNAGGLIQQLAGQNPAALEAVLDSLPTNLRAIAERYVVGEKLKASFDDEIRNLYDRPDGFKIFFTIMENGSDDDPLKLNLLDELASFPPSWRTAFTKYAHTAISSDNGTKWANSDLEGMGFTTEQSQMIRTLALDRISSKHPQQALELLNSHEVPENTRKNLINNIFGYTRDKPELTETLLAMLDSEEERDAARTVVDANSSRAETLKIEQPSEWLEQARSGDSKNGSFYNLTSKLRKWDTDKIDALSRGFDAMPDESKLKIAQNLMNSDFSEVGPLEAQAVRYLVEHPASSEGSPGIKEDHAIQLASRYVGKMAQDDPAAASEWIHSLPAGDAKLWAQKNLHSLWSQYDPQAADEWMTTLPATERTKVQAFRK